ncbi:serine/threonine-protein phosphatase 2A 56 kDa regulatory subunit delta isoform [Coemansia sp. Benny D115]|nr:serine/threonine-protein phosphatase 2A 56 kDa regulatory subunit delta isoform [Coemansia sp. Benny D115]
MVRARKPAGSFAASERIFAAQIDAIPNLRVARRPQSSRHSLGGTHEFRMLPPLLSEQLTDIERKDLLSQKLVQCTVLFDFQNPNENIEAKEAKQRTLGEILDYMSERTGVITLDMYPKLFKMVSANLFRTIPPQINAFGDPFDPEEDEPREEPSWPHLCLVYHIFLRFLESSDFNNSAARPYIDQAFTTQLLELFDCEDVRERESLKTVLHRIYGKMLGMRSFIRRSINNIFLQFIYETQRHNGIAELLEILGSIINGFTVPLKDEHINFLHRVLLPLHKARPMNLYFAQLAYCTVQFLEKDPTLADTIVKSLLRFWPKVNSPKEVMFVTEIEGIMDVIEPAQFSSICQPLFQQLVKCIVSPHFQIAERTLGMWRNNYFVNLITDNIQLILPIALSGIYRHSRSHWNRNIHNQVYQILRFFVNVNEELFEQCLSDFRRQRDNERKRSVKNSHWWTAVEKLAMEKKAASAPESPTVVSPTTANSEASLNKSSTSPAAATVASNSVTAEAGPDSPTKDGPGRNKPANGILQTANGAAAEPGPGSDAADRWAHLPSELPMSKLDDPDTMSLEMDEEEFIRELDKFVDIIKAEDPETAMTNGMMLLDESDGSAIVDEVLGAAGQNAYPYNQQLQQQHHHDQQQHAAILHGMAGNDDRMNVHMIMDPTSMQMDFSGSIGSSEAPLSVPSSMIHQSLADPGTYLHQHHYADHDHASHAGNDTDLSLDAVQMGSAVSAADRSPSGGDSIGSATSPPAPGDGISGAGWSDESPGQNDFDEIRRDVMTRTSMDTTTTPPPSHASS